MGRIEETSGFTDVQFAKARDLVEKCNTNDSLDYLHLTKEMNSYGHHFQFYDGHILAGLLTFPFNGSTQIADPEAYEVVAPAYRRRGVGRELINAAKEYCGKIGVNSFLLVCEDGVEAGRAFVRAVGGEFSRSELRMKLTERPRKLSGFAVQLRQVEFADLDLLSRLFSNVFESPVESHLQRLNRDLRSTNHRFYVASLTEKAVGCIGVVSEDRRVYVIAFGVLAQYRRHGYGRQILTQTLNGLISENWDEIFIETESTNRIALSLYESCGFRQRTSYNYYTIISTD